MELAPTELTPPKLTLKELTLTELALSSPLKLLSPVSAPLRVATKLQRHQGKWSTATMSDWTVSEREKNVSCKRRRSALCCYCRLGESSTCHCWLHAAIPSTPGFTVGMDGLHDGLRITRERWLTEEETEVLLRAPVRSASAYIAAQNTSRLLISVRLNQSGFQNSWQPPFFFSPALWPGDIFQLLSNYFKNKNKNKTVQHAEWMLSKQNAGKLNK